MKKTIAAILLGSALLGCVQVEAAPKKADYFTTSYRLPLIFKGFFVANPALDSIPMPRISYHPGIMTTRTVLTVPEIEGEEPEETVVLEDVAISPALEFTTPEWLRDFQERSYMQNKLLAYYVLTNPDPKRGAYSQLYKAPEMPVRNEETLEDALNTIELPPIASGDETEIVPIVQERHNWLHVVNAGLQFSQAFLSPNWYQGGNNHLSLIGNFLWDVQLNQVYHPNLMLQNTISYKLALNSSPSDTYHKYNISEDIFQWNFKFGVKAWNNKWFYSLTSQFKTQMLNNYEQNSPVRKASFLSPGDLNVGVGMTYSMTSKNNKFKLNISLAPLSYNLKSCIDSQVDPTQFGLAADQKWKSEIGSNGELTFDWNLTSNINYKSRLFLFSDYKYFQGDWENTVAFTINRFLSTQVYWRLRYDTSRPSQEKWGHWMLKEILSFGLSYTFNTKK